MLWKFRLPKRIPLLNLVDPVTKYLIKEGMPLHMPLVSSKEPTLANLLFPKLTQNTFWEGVEAR